MRKKYVFGKKLYISVLTSILVLLTTVATTFAWVGVFANSTFESFDIGIRGSELNEYSIRVSATGEEGSFSDTIDFYDIKKQILLNWGGISESDLYSKERIDALYSSLNMDQATTLPNATGTSLVKLGNFVDLYGNDTSKYYKFDIYISAEQNYDAGSSSDFNLDVYLGDGLLTGSIGSRYLVNSFSFPDTFINPLLGNLPIDSPIQPIIGGTKITKATINSASAARVAFEKYEVVDRGHPEKYTNLSEPISTIIYSGDKYDSPTYNSETQVHEFGGILQDDINVAIGYYNSTEFYWAKYGLKSISMPDDIYNIRGVTSVTKDRILDETTNHLIDSTNPNEKIGVGKMMKVTISFWFEGWDADCFNPINLSPVNLNIKLGMTPDYEF